jgi:Ca-activated chloride channel family protein
VYKRQYEKTGDSTWRLPDLAYGAEAWALVRLQLTKEQVATLGAGQGANLLTASVRYDDLGGEPRAIQPQSLALAAVPASAFGAITEDELVRRRVEELEAAKIQQEARLAAKLGDWDGVDRLLVRVKKLGADNEWVRNVAAELSTLASRRDEAMFSKEAMYSARRMRNRLASRDESDAHLSRLDVPDFLRSKSAQGKRDPRRPS